jgi:hypothetical protein
MFGSTLALGAGCKQEGWPDRAHKRFDSKGTEECNEKSTTIHCGGVAINQTINRSIHPSKLNEQYVYISCMLKNIFINFHVFLWLALMVT